MWLSFLVGTRGLLSTHALQTLGDQPRCELIETYSASATRLNQMREDIPLERDAEDVLYLLGNLHPCGPPLAFELCEIVGVPEFSGFLARLEGGDPAAHPGTLLSCHGLPSAPPGVAPPFGCRRVSSTNHIVLASILRVGEGCHVPSVIALPDEVNPPAWPSHADEQRGVLHNLFDFPILHMMPRAMCSTFHSSHLSCPII